MLVVSACLAGINCRYDGGHQLIKKINELVEQRKAIVVCPEVLGGLDTPREPAEIVGGSGEDVLDGKAKVINRLGEDVTDSFIKGAYETLKRVKEVGATAVVLKENSPSCGSNMIYNGNFSNEKVSGEGVTAALLRKEGINVLSEAEMHTLFEKE
ncbi:DUF523 domain-containing protein [Bacillus aquiflavi]|uniref:DUF523 domain-containing protein n=1 Tax=Bacillus aquiflavi TaxID=2672567 RepID=A0A6B3VXB2_9BACI|nr:DUF523 domain-containing protein [Bacillus aquiflavi]MBA4537366.1 DUF523 domain-containing protein [Bacillus aquiflavi]NEY81622.1 DUF523 domain-containing protein [Bacillus aquiflavi]UAC49190.1 DUF523 domain-containing protein [Bacillus aquiflavi]